MHSDELHAGGFRAARQLRRVFGLVVPAEPHLQCHRHLDCGDRRLDQPDRMIEIAHQRRARLAAGDMACRAAHVDVDDIGAGRLRHAGTLGHPMCLAAGELHHMRPDAAGFAAQPGHPAPAHQIVARGHLGDHEPCPQLGGEPPERRVGYPGHRRQEGAVPQRNLTDFQRLVGIICRTGHGKLISSLGCLIAASLHCEHISCAVKRHAYSLDKTIWLASALQQNMLVRAVMVNVAACQISA